MTWWSEILSTGAAGALALGGGAAIAIAVLKWFGGVFSDQIAAATRQTHAVELERLRSQYSAELEQLRARLHDTTARLDARIDTAVYRSKAQFDLEFAVLQRIWTALSETRRQFGNVRAGFHYLGEDENAEDALLARANAFLATVNTLKPAIHDNEPVLPAGDLRCSPRVHRPLRARGD